MATKTVDLKTIKKQFADDPEKMVLIAIGGVSLMAFFFMGQVMSAGIFLGICTALSMMLLLFKARTTNPKLWNTVCEYPLAADAAISFSILAFTATGVIGIIAGVIGALAASAGVKYAVDGIGKSGDDYYKLPFLTSATDSKNQKQEEQNDQPIEQAA